MDVLHDDLIPMVVSLVLGTLVGLERQMGRKPAGLRTHVLVCIGSTMFVLTTKHAVVAFGGPSLDATRVVHGVVTGVGFLGAGSIMDGSPSSKAIRTPMASLGATHRMIRGEPPARQAWRQP